MTDLRDRIRDSAIMALSLFTSSGTLVCCALPVTLVSLGLGSAVVGLTGTFPWLVTLSQHKAWVFAVSAGLLVLGGWMIHRPGRSCPTDPALSTLCTRFDFWNRRIYWVSLGIWGIGFLAAYVLLPVSRFLGLA